MRLGRLLQRGNLRDANLVRDKFAEMCPSVADDTECAGPHPLWNFLRFLLTCLEYEAFPLFMMLRHAYRDALQAEPSFETVRCCRYDWVGKGGLEFLEPSRCTTMMLVSPFPQMLDRVARVFYPRATAAMASASRS